MVPSRPRRDAEAASEAVEGIAAGLPPDPRVLVTGPPGSGKSRLVLAAFDSAWERHGADRVLLVLPTYGEVEHQKRVAISRREERRLARGILDAPFATFTSLAERLSPGFRVRDLPTRRERDLLAAEALRRADVEAFRGVADQPGFRARFLRLVKEVKQAGDAPAVATARLAEGRDVLPGEAAQERLDGFLRVFAEYESLLAAAGFSDHEDVLRTLLASVRAGPTGLSDTALLVVDGFEDLTGVERALLLAAADAVTKGGGRVLVTLPSAPGREALYRPTEPLRHDLHGHGFVLHELREFRRSEGPALARLAADLFREPAQGGTSARKPVAPGDDLRPLVGSDDADEVDRIGREILRLRREEPGVAPAWRDVAIVFRRLDGRGTGAQRILAALGIPSRLVGTGPAALRRGRRARGARTLGPPRGGRRDGRVRLRRAALPRLRPLAGPRVEDAVPRRAARSARDRVASERHPVALGGGCRRPLEGLRGPRRPRRRGRGGAPRRAGRIGRRRRVGPGRAEPAPVPPPARLPTASTPMGVPSTRRATSGSVARSPRGNGSSRWRERRRTPRPARGSAASPRCARR